MNADNNIPADTGVSETAASFNELSLTSRSIATSNVPEIKPRPADGLAAVQHHIESGQARMQGWTENIRAAGVARPFSFKLEQDPRQKSFMGFFCRTGLGQVVFKKKAVFWESCPRIPSPEKQEQDAKKMAMALGIADYKTCKPKYPQNAKEAFDVMQEAARLENRVLRDEEFTHIYIDDPERERIHFFAIYRPLLAQAMKESPRQFGLPENPSEAEIQVKMKHILNPENISKITNTRMFWRAMYEDEYSVDRYGDLKSQGKTPAEIQKEAHPVTQRVQSLATSTCDDQLHWTAVGPIWMVYFQEKFALKNIKDTEWINEELAQAQARSPDESFATVALWETLKRMYR
jgi:hypothetical protein